MTGGTPADAIAGDVPPAGARCLVSVRAPLDVAAARVVLLNVIVARQTHGSVTIRLDDADDADDAAAALETVAGDLAWLEFAAALEIERTSARRGACIEAARDLVRRGRATQYAGAIVVRLAAGQTVIDDAVKGRVRFDNAALGDIVLIDAGGAVHPVFAATFDDVDFGTTFVLREDRDLEHTAAALHVFAALDREPPRSAHIGTLLADNDALPSIGRLRRAGIQPAALLDHLALLGWSPRAPQEAFSLADLVAMFTFERVGHGSAHFNEPRLRAFNARALRALPRAELAAQLMAAMQRSGLLEVPAPDAARRWVDTFLDAYGTEVATLTQALELVADLRAEAVVVPALELEKLRSRQVIFYLDAVGQYVDAQAELRNLPLAHDLPAIAGEFGLASDDALAAVRMALTGKHDGAPLGLLFPLLGHDRILIRIGAISSHLLHGRGLEPIKFGPGGVPFETIQAQRPD